MERLETGFVFRTAGPPAPGQPPSQNHQTTAPMIRTRRLWEERFHPADKGWGILDIALHPNRKTLLIAAFEKGFHRFELDANGPAVVGKHQIREKNGHRGHVIKVAWHPSGKHFATCTYSNIAVLHVH